MNHRFIATIPAGMRPCLLMLALSCGVASADEPANENAAFDLVCTTTLDRVEGTLADGSPVLPSEIGEVRRYSFDLPGMRYTSGSRIHPIHRLDGHTVIKADPDEIRSLGGIVHMQSEWLLDLDTGLSIRKNRFFSDASGDTVTGRSEWHQQCERAPYSAIAEG